MNRKLKQNQKIIIVSFLAILLLVVLVGNVISFYVSDKDKYSNTVEYKQMGTSVKQDDRNGWYIDNTFVEGYSGMFTYGPELDLKKGSYTITINYKTDTNENYILGDTTTKSYTALQMDKIPLNSTTDNISFDIRLWEDVKDMNFSTYYGGSGYLIISSISIVQNNAIYKMFLSIICVIMLLILLGYFAKRYHWFSNITIQQKVVFFTILVIGIYASYPNLNGACYVRDDFSFHMLRIQGIIDALKEGQFPAKMYPNWMYGYGYPAGIYYGSLFLYIPAFLVLAGCTLQMAYMIFLIGFNILTAYIMYYSVNKMLKNYKIGLLGAFLYTLAPYRLMDIYPRGAVGEWVAITFLPLILYSIWSIFYHNGLCDKKANNKSILLLAIGLTAVIQSHTITAYLVAITILLSCLILIKKVINKYVFISLLKAAVFTIIINLGYLLPFLTTISDMRIIDAGDNAGGIQQWGLSLNQLFNLFYLPYAYNYTEALSGPYGEQAYGIGFAVLMGSVVFIYSKFILKTQNKYNFSGTYFLSAGILSVLMTTYYFPWNSISHSIGSMFSLINSIQFPFRITAFANTFLIFAACIGIYNLFDNKEKSKSMYANCSVVALTVLTIVSASNMMDGLINTHNSETMYDIASLGRTDSNVSEYLLPGTDISKVANHQPVASAGIIVTEYEKFGTTIKFTEENLTGKNGYIDLPMLYYKQYVATSILDHSDINISQGENNCIRVEISTSDYQEIEVSFKQPLSWRISQLISLLFIVYLLFDTIIKYNKGHKNEKTPVFTKES